MSDEAFLNGEHWVSGMANLIEKAKASRNTKENFYFDIETIPDYSRESLFDLPELPELPTDRTQDTMLTTNNAAEMLSGTIEDVKRVLTRNLFPISFLRQVEVMEKAGKNRKGVIDQLALAKEQKNTAAQAHADRLTLLSTTPEFCSIVAIGWAYGNQECGSLVADGVITETTLLQTFWGQITEADKLVGYNILGFDLPVIMVRSAILGVPATRSIDLSPWGRDVLDLYLRRFGPRGNTSSTKPGRLKELAKLYGMNIPAGETSGADVHRLAATPEGREKLAEYVASDVQLVRELHRFLTGYFWV